MTTTQRLFSYLTALAVTVTLVACQPAIAPYAENYYDPELTIALVGEAAQEGTWQTFDVVVDYRYRSTGDTLEISGTASLGQHYRDLYERLTKLEVYLFLLDDTARVLQSKQIGQVLASHTDAELTFTETLPLAPGVTRIAFGYEGRVRGSDPEPDGNGDWFYKLPLARTP